MSEVPSVESLKKQFKNKSMKELYDGYQDCWTKYKKLKDTPEKFRTVYGSRDWYERDLKYYYNCAEAYWQTIKERKFERANVQILVRKSTKTRLENIRQDGETSDDVIVRLLNFYEQNSKESLIFD